MEYIVCRKMINIADGEYSNYKELLTTRSWKEAVEYFEELRDDHASTLVRDGGAPGHDRCITAIDHHFEWITVIWITNSSL